MDSRRLSLDKKPHPREKATIFSILTFCWTLPTFVKGWKKKLTNDDFRHPLGTHRSSLLGPKLAKIWDDEIKLRIKKKPSLLRAFIKTFGLELFFYGLLITLSETFRLCQPLILGGLIDSISSGNLKNASFFTAGLILSSVATAFLSHSFYLGVGQLGMKMRISTCSLIYNKVLLLRHINVGDLTTGRVINLMSNDAIRFDVAATFFHDLWIGPVQTLIITYFLYDIAGVAAFIGVATILIFTPFQLLLGKWTSSLRLKAAKSSDYRIGLMGEIVKGIQVVKMHAWEKPFEALVSNARQKELNIIKTMSHIKGAINSFSMYHTRVATSLTIITFVLLGGTINAKNVSWFEQATKAVCVLESDSIVQRALNIALVFTITCFFNVLSTTATLAFPMGITIFSEFLMSVRRVQEFLLLDSDCEKPCKAEVATPVVEMKNVSAKWRISSAENTLSNISFKATNDCLTVIFGNVGAGKTSILHSFLGELILTEGTITLNGKTSLASQEPWIFHGTIRQNILFGEEYNKTRYDEVLRVCALRNDLDHFPEGDLTFVGERGTSLSGGQKSRVNLARAVYKKADVYFIDNPFASLDSAVANQIYQECIRGFLNGKIVILITHNANFINENDQIIHIENGSLKSIGHLNEISGSVLAKIDDRIEEETNDENFFGVENNETERLTKKGENESSWSSYKKYFTAMGFCSSFSSLALFIGAQVFSSSGDYWLSYWVYCEEQYKSNKTEFVIFSDENDYIYVLIGLVSATVIVSIIRSLAHFSFCLKASKKLHKNMFKSITRAKMSFFNNSTSGNILGRFSKDIGILDEHLPLAMIDFFQIALTAIGIIVLIPTTNIWLLIPTFVALFLFVLMRLLYVTTSKSMRKIEAVTSTPVYSHVSNTINGLSTIHASNNEEILRKEFDAHQDNHSSSWYMYIATARAFAFWLDMIAVVYSAVITISFIFIETDGRNVGLAITQSFGLFSILQWGVRQSAEMDNHMISVERVVDLIKVEQEPPLEVQKGISMLEGWPRRGEITFTKVDFKYVAEGPTILKNLTFTISGGDKVGIVGRTGSGKSSIINALFRLGEISGSIKIDGVDITLLGLHDFRPKITVIPQQPILFAGSLRKNLDPFNQKTDDQLWKCLEEVGLKEFVKSENGLDMEIKEGAQNLSVGQRQLIFLARGILTGNNIVVMDEATSNIDIETEALIEDTLRQKFQFSTVITIAHRLNAILDSDLIIVMENGTIVQIGHPFVLLNNEGSLFYNLIADRGGLSDKIMEDLEMKFKQKRKINEKCV